MSLKKCFSEKDVKTQISLKASKDAIIIHEYLDGFIDTIIQDAPLSTDELRSIDTLNQDEFQELFSLYAEELEKYFLKFS